MNLIIIVVARDGEPLYSNRVALDYTGVTPGELPFVRFGGRLSHPEDVEKLRTIRQEALARGEMFQLEQRMLGTSESGCFGSEPPKDNRQGGFRGGCDERAHSAKA